MVQRMILRTQEKCIYEIEEANLKFYLLIPNAKKVFLTICLLEDPTDMSIQKIVQEQNKVLVIPIIERSVLAAVLSNQESAFQVLDKSISGLINLSHQILVYNHMEVENVVYFSGQAFSNFEEWFIQKYQGRVARTEVRLKVDEKPREVIKDPASIDNTMTLAASLEQTEKVVPVDEVETTRGSSLEEKSRDLGFVSYVLLGVIVAVVSLVFLYLII